MDDLKKNLLLAVNARKMAGRDDVGTSGIDEPDPTLMAAYQNVFINSADGKIVLEDLLNMMKFSEKGSDLYHMAMRNLGLEILARCGIKGSDILRLMINGL